MTLRVLNLGLPKSGTTTLARALKIAGFKVADHRIRAKQTPLTHLHEAYVADLVYAGYFASGDPASELQGFDAITEMSCLRDEKSLWPQMDYALIAAMRKHNPGLKLLASRRDGWEMSRSMLAWSDLGVNRVPNQAIPGLPPGYGETSAERAQWIDGHYEHLQALFGDDPDFLEFDVSAPDARAQVQAHIGVPLTWWGKANRNTQFARQVAS